jgi:hypothetical protein
VNDLLKTRLQMINLEQVCAIFDHGSLILIGMPGIEKRLVGFPQFSPPRLRPCVPSAEIFARIILMTRVMHRLLT